MTEQQHHFYGSTAFNWAVAQTREEVVKKLASATGADLIKRNVAANGGLYCWTCKVELPQEAHYDINFYKPVDVPISEAQEFNILNAKGKTSPYVRKE